MHHSSKLVTVHIVHEGCVMGGCSKGRHLIWGEGLHNVFSSGGQECKQSGVRTDWPLVLFRTTEEEGLEGDSKAIVWVQCRHSVTEQFASGEKKQQHYSSLHTGGLFKRFLNGLYV